MDEHSRLKLIGPDFTQHLPIFSTLINNIFYSRRDWRSLQQVIDLFTGFALRVIGSELLGRSIPNRG
ncbi:MAG: hypothetical protein WBM39_01425 [Parasphingorhabdus sp.]